MQGKKERDAYVSAVHKVESRPPPYFPPTALPPPGVLLQLTRHPQARAADAMRKRKAKKSGEQPSVSDSQQQQNRLSAQFRQRATTPAAGAGAAVSHSILSRVFQA